MFHENPADFTKLGRLGIEYRTGDKDIPYQVVYRPDTQREFQTVNKLAQNI